MCETYLNLTPLSRICHGRREKGEVRNGTVLLPNFPNPALTENLFQKTGFYSVWARFARKKGLHEYTFMFVSLISYNFCH